MSFDYCTHAASPHEIAIKLCLLQFIQFIKTQDESCNTCLDFSWNFGEGFFVSLSSLFITNLTKMNIVKIIPFSCTKILADAFIIDKLWVA
jgi:hypothetical protein